MEKKPLPSYDIFKYSLQWRQPQQQRQRQMWRGGFEVYDCHENHRCLPPNFPTQMLLQMHLCAMIDISSPSMQMIFYIHSFCFRGRTFFSSLVNGRWERAMLTMFLQMDLVSLMMTLLVQMTSAKTFHSRGSCETEGWGPGLQMKVMNPERPPVQNMWEQWGLSQRSCGSE